MYPLVFSENKPSAWLEASRIQWLCVFSCWVKLRFRGKVNSTLIALPADTT